MVFPRRGTWLFSWWRGNYIRSRNVRKMVIPGTASRPFLRKRENAFSGSEMSKTATRPFRWWRGTFFRSRNEGKNVYFGNGSPAVSPKGENTFSSSEKLKNRNFANGKPAVSTVRTKRFQFPKPCNFTSSEPAVSPEARKRFLRREHFPTFRSLKNHFLATRDTSGFRTRSYHFWTFLRLKKPFFAPVRKRPNFRRFRSGKSSVSETMKNGLCCSSR